MSVITKERIERMKIFCHHVSAKRVMVANVHYDLCPSCHAALSSMISTAQEVVVGE